MSLRATAFWCHLAAGLAAGLPILSMALSGALIGFAPQVLSIAERDQRTLPAPAPQNARLGAGTLLAALRTQLPEARPTALSVQADPRAAAQISLGRDGVAFVDPASGRLLGRGAPRLRAFVRAAEDWHRWFAAEGVQRPLWRGVNGAANAAFFILALSGCYLWWPAQWSRQHLAPIAWFRSGLRGRARDFNWHNTVGLWCAPPLVLISASALAISYPWAANLLYPSGPGPQRSQPAAERANLSAEQLDRLWDRALRQAPDWHTLSVRIPPQASGPVSFSLETRAGAGRSQLSLDPATGAVVKWEPHEAFGLGRRLRSSIRPIHTGEIGGLFGQALATLASLGGALLVWTGLSLALRRFTAWRRS